MHSSSGPRHLACLLFGGSVFKSVGEVRLRACAGSVASLGLIVNG